MISENTDYAVENLIYPDFKSLSTATLDGSVDLFWLGPVEYLYLNWEGAAQVILMTNHLGVYAYGVQFMAHTQRGFTSYYDPETGRSVGNPINALQQFAGTRPCLLNPESLPGYYIPMGLLANASSPTLDPVFTYDYSATVRALYIQGICDFGVGYALVGDPRTAGDIQQDLPDVQDQVEVIWQTEGIIPNISLSESSHLPLHVSVRLQEAFLDLSETQEGLRLLSAALGYEVEALKEVEDQFYDPLRDAIVPLEPDLEAILFPPSNP
jgi:phosphonate transport system substrate-binding protein